MQLHPNEPGGAVKYSVESLAAGYIGLDFAAEISDLTTVVQSTLPENQKDYWAFAHEMQEGDSVLIIAHHFPFALAKIVGPYNFIKTISPEIGVWFRHFRKVEDVKYYADFVTNARSWQSLKMTDTISPLRSEDSMSYRLISDWLASGV
jgi:hypothetical protein